MIGLLSLSFGRSLAFVCIKCTSLNNWICQVRAILVSISSTELFYYLFPVSANKFDGSFNSNDDSYAQIYVPNKVINMHANVFNLMPGVNEAGCLVQHQLWEQKYGLNKKVCNSKQNLRSWQISVLV